MPIGLGIWEHIRHNYEPNKLENLAKYCVIYRKPINFNVQRHYVLLDFYNGGWDYAKEREFRKHGFELLYSEKRLNVKDTWEQMIESTGHTSNLGRSGDEQRNNNNKREM